MTDRYVRQTVLSEGRGSPASSGSPNRRFSSSAPAAWVVPCCNTSPVPESAA